MLAIRAAFCVCNILVIVFIVYSLNRVRLSAIGKDFHPPAQLQVIGSTRGPTTTPVPQTDDYEFVIAHFNENLDWLKPVANCSHVYDKGHDAGLKPSFSVKDWEELPNVGRESHTYLYHIINNYENLRNITIFLQGEISNHAPHACYQTPLEFLEKAKNGNFCVSFGKQTNWGRIPHIDKWKSEYDRGLMRHAEVTIGQFYQDVFGRAPPTSGVDSCHAGCFSATRKCLQRHPKEFYQKWISYVDDHVNPKESHYMERLWLAMITC